MHSGAIRTYFSLLLIGVAGGLCGCSATSGWVMNSSGQAYYEQGNYSMARAEFARAVADNPYASDYKYNLAMAMKKQGDPAGAEHVLRQTLQADALHQPSYHGLAQLMIEQNRHAEAQQLLSTWVAAQPYQSQSHIEMAWLQRELGNPAGAEQSLRHALQVEPGNPVALAQLGQLYQDHGRSQEAVAMYQRSLYANWNQPAVQSRLATLERRAYPSVTPSRSAMLRSPSYAARPNYGRMAAGYYPARQAYAVAYPPAYAQPPATAFAPPPQIVLGSPVPLGGDPAHVQPSVTTSLPVIAPY